MRIGGGDMTLRIQGANRGCDRIEAEFSQNSRSIKLPNLAWDDRRILKTVAGSANFVKIACLHAPGFRNTYSSTKISAASEPG